MALIVVRHGSGATLLQRQSGRCAVKRLNLALFVDRQDDGGCGRIDIEPDAVAQFVDEARIVGQQTGASGAVADHGRPNALDELTLTPAALAIKAPSPWGGLTRRVAKRQGDPARSVASALSGLIREGTRLVTKQGVEPVRRKRSCPARQTQVLDLAVRRMISFVPTPSAVNSTISARQTCFCGALRSCTTALTAGEYRPRTKRRGFSCAHRADSHAEPASGIPARTQMLGSIH